MKTWITIPVENLNDLDYSVLKITNAESAPRNIAGDTALIKWIGDMPETVSVIAGKGDPLDYDGAKTLLDSSEWKMEVQI